MDDLQFIPIPERAPALLDAAKLLQGRGRRVLDVIDVYAAGDRRADDLWGIPRDTVLWRNHDGQPMTTVVIVEHWDGESDSAQRIKTMTREGWD